MRPVDRSHKEGEMDTFEPLEVPEPQSPESDDEEDDVVIVDDGLD